jgi:hypothetical protein
LITNKGEAYILEEKADGTFSIQYSKGGITEIVSKNSFLEEKDSDEIKYDEKELLEIENHRKERIIEMQKNRKAKGCRAWC